MYSITIQLYGDWFSVYQLYKLILAELIPMKERRVSTFLNKNQIQKAVFINWKMVNGILEGFDKKRGNYCQRFD